MKKYLILILIPFLISCSENRSDLIIGKWKINDIVTPVNWSKVDPTRRAQIEKDIEDHVAIQKTFGWYKFEKGGKAISFDGKEQFVFRWRMSEDEETIYFKPVNGVAEDAFRIERMEEEAFLITKKEADGMELRITLVKDTE